MNGDSFVVGEKVLYNDCDPGEDDGMPGVVIEVIHDRGDVTRYRIAWETDSSTSIESGKWLRHPEPKDNGLPEKIERLEKEIAAMREAQSVRATTIRKLRMDLDRTTKERDALANTLAEVRRLGMEVPE